MKYLKLLIRFCLAPKLFLRPHITPTATQRRNLTSFKMPSEESNSIQDNMRALDLLQSPQQRHFYDIKEQYDSSQRAITTNDSSQDEI